MSHQKITDPEALLTLSDQELARSLQPLLRGGGFSGGSRRKGWAEEHLRSVCWELAERWRAKPFLGERQVDFGEYLAANLCTALQAEHRKQHPDRYDNHGKYQPEQEPVYMDDLDGKYFAIRGRSERPSDPAPSLETLVQTSRSADIAEPSINALLQHIADIPGGKIKSPYRLARAQGLSPLEARYQPATAAYLALSDYACALAAATSPYTGGS